MLFQLRQMCGRGRTEVHVGVATTPQKPAQLVYVFQLLRCVLLGAHGVVKHDAVKSISYDFVLSRLVCLAIVCLALLHSLHNVAWDSELARACNVPCTSDRDAHLMHLSVLTGQVNC